jgi:hypothetical protein
MAGVRFKSLFLRKPSGTQPFGRVLLISSHCFTTGGTAGKWKHDPIPEGNYLTILKAAERAGAARFTVQKWVEYGRLEVWS